MSDDRVVLSPDDTLAQLPGPDGERFVELFRHGTLDVELYAPRVRDSQMPHTRDEVYVVARGSATYWDGRARSAVRAGDFIFVAAGIEHRFEQMSDDFAVWVMFYGPEGGE